MSVSEASSTTALVGHDSSLPLRRDYSAWKLVWDWAAGVFEFPRLITMMEKFDGRYVEEEWRDLFNAVFDASRPSEDDVDDANLLSASSANPPSSKPRTIQIVEDAMASLGLSFPATRTFVPRLDSSSRTNHASHRRGQRPAKRRKTTSIFLDIAAEDDDEDVDDEEDDDDDADKDGDEEEDRPRRVPVVQPAGQALYAERLAHVIARYEPRGRTDYNKTTPSSDPSTLPIPVSAGHELRVYIVTFPTGRMAQFCRLSFEKQDLRCWDVPHLPHKIYVQGLSPFHIRNTCPPSHSSSIRSINILPEQDHTVLYTPQPPLAPPRSWVRILRGPYRHDIGYVLSADAASCEALVLPHRRPYDVVDKGDIPEIKAQKRSERKLFSPDAAKNAGLEVVPSGTNIVRCQGAYYHHGLLRRKFTKSFVEVVETPHPDHIASFAEARVDPDLVERSHLNFSARFWKHGDLVRPLAGSFAGERATVVSVDLDRSLATVRPCDPDLETFRYETQVLGVRRVFRCGDTVKVLAGIHRGSNGSVISVIENDVSLVLESTEMVVVPSLFLETYVAPHVLSTISSHPGLSPEILHQTTRSFDENMPGDLVEIVRGKYCGATGTVESMEEFGFVWVSIWFKNERDDDDNEANGFKNRDGVDVDELGYTTILAHLDELVIYKPAGVLSYTTENGYGVSVGDTLQIVRGELHGTIGVVRAFNFAKAEAELISEVDGCPIIISVQLCSKFQNCSLPVAATKSIGRDVWIIRGEKKGFRATLHAVNRTTSLVSFPGHHTLELKNSELATESGFLLDGTSLKGAALEQFKSIVKASFRSSQREQTPPPLEAACENASSAWRVTEDDLAIDKGCVEWLFNDLFCDYSRYQLCFNVSAGYRGGNYTKRVMRTGHDRFFNDEGQARPGHVALSVSGNHTGSAVEYHHVPARFLSPASPTSKGQVVLVLRGDLQGQFCQVTRWVRKEKKAVVTPDSTLSSSRQACTMPAEDVCLVVPFS